MEIGVHRHPRHGGEMKPLEQILAEADRHKVAVGHFNISDLVALKAVSSAALELNVPVLVGVSEGEREFIGVRQIAALVRSIREEYDFPIYLNADHTHSIEKAREAAQAGFDLVVFDGSSLPFEENVAKTKQAVTEMKAIHPSILVEGEVGFIGSSRPAHRCGCAGAGRGYDARDAEEHGVRCNQEARRSGADRGDQARDAKASHSAWGIRYRGPRVSGRD
jgi:fructose/tagatose bisphosphate aldolase